MTENKLQQQIFTWHWNHFPKERGLLFMVHNSASNRIQGARLKSMGMLRGVSDMIYLNPTQNRPQFLELKIESGRQSIYQKQWQKLLSSHNYSYHIIRSKQDFINICKPEFKAA